MILAPTVSLLTFKFNDDILKLLNQFNSFVRQGMIFIFNKNACSINHTLFNDICIRLV